MKVLNFDDDDDDERKKSQKNNFSSNDRSGHHQKRSYPRGVNIRSKFGFSRSQLLLNSERNQCGKEITVLHHQIILKSINAVL